MSNMDDNDRLARLAGKIRADLVRREASKAEWIEATIDLCLDLAEARREFPDDQGFGHWFAASKFDLNDHDRAAAIAMGQDPEQLRQVLATTERRSLQLIYKHEFRSASASKPTQTKATRSERGRAQLQKARDGLDAIKARGEQPTQAAIRKETGCGIRVAGQAVAADEVEAAADAQPLPELPPSAQQKLDAHARRLERALDKRRKELESDFDKRVHEACQKRDEERRLPYFFKRLSEIEAMLAWRPAIMSKVEYHSIVLCLHADTAMARTQEQRDAALRTLLKYKLKLVDDYDERLKLTRDIPHTRAEMG